MDQVELNDEDNGKAARAAKLELENALKFGGMNDSDHYENQRESVNAQKQSRRHRKMLKRLRKAS